MQIRKLAAALAVSVLAFVPSAASAQAWPAKPVKVVSPYSSGSGPDVFLRVVGDKLSRQWGQQVLVDARAGANGFIAIESVKKAAPDGYEMLLVGNAHATINPNLFAKIPYDIEADFTPVAMLYRTPFYITVAANGPYRNVADIIAAAKAEPGKLTYGTPYVGSPAHLGSVNLELLTGTRMIHVPFKDTVQIYASVGNGDVSWAFGTIGSTLSIVKTGKARLIAVAAKTRSPGMPDVPTIGEAGGPAGLEVDAWVAILAPKRTPADIVRRVNAEVSKLLGDADIRDRLNVLGFEAYPTTPEQVSEIIRTDLRKNADLVRRTGAKAD